MIWLRFKIATSFIIAGLGLIMFVRLASLVSISRDTFLDFLAPALFIVAGVWRGLIFVKAGARAKT